MEKYTFTLTLTATQIEYMRHCLSDLGHEISDCLRIQLAVANALLDCGYINRSAVSTKSD